ncbi:MAG TPA: nicotinamide-nucleotide adenylyltransferase [Candidatus Methanoperedenaceae archaeon]|nr:nicotinamide-nucleotide adenylyltransferase [Candidatus Methanoperedenaceae archaeon]
MRRGLYIGRFQPYHLGHHTVIRQISADVDELIIAIGSAQRSHEPDNPFTAGERVLMVTRALSELCVKHYAIPVEDIQRNVLWASHVISMVPPFDVVYSNNPLVTRLFREAVVPVEHSPLFKRKEYSGTEIRRRMLSGEEWEHLVPGSVAAIINEVGGVERLRAVAAQDK